MNNNIADKFIKEKCSNIVDIINNMIPEKWKKYILDS